MSGRYSSDRYTAVSPTATRGHVRAAVLILQLGALAAIVAASPFKAFELDRFFVPKEIALHATAFIAGLLSLWGVRAITLGRVDWLLALYLGWSAVSSAFSSNLWLSTRALAISLSGIVVYWTTRALAAAGLRRPLLWAIVVAVVAGAASALAQAYGWESNYLSLSRAPGGLFGNRNFVAHVSAIGAPILVYCVLSARRGVSVALGALGAIIVSTALVLSRSRAAWLALLVCVVLLTLPAWRAVRRSQDRRIGRRFIVLTVSALIGVAAALLIPNRLNWRSDSPYLDSVRGVVDYRRGSGHGRVLQYTNTLKLVESHPIFGVGPGNWSVYYPRVAKSSDPSLTDEGVTANPWPSSDWMALLAERGAVAVGLLGLALVGMLVVTWRAPTNVRREGAIDARLAPLALTAVLLVTVIVGAFDAVLLLAAPTMIVWASLGSLAASGQARMPTRGRRWLLLAILLCGVTLARSTAALVVMRLTPSSAARGSECAWPRTLIEGCRTNVRIRNR